MVESPTSSCAPDAFIPEPLQSSLTPPPPPWLPHFSLFLVSGTVYHQTIPNTQSTPHLLLPIRAQTVQITADKFLYNNIRFDTINKIAFFEKFEFQVGNS